MNVDHDAARDVVDIDICQASWCLGLSTLKIDAEDSGTTAALD
ncbi:MAG: hypothetical protein OXH60_07745 [Rhodospirillales bacterium]|nr:hypothetical protein [Rhodospirillales bacterium]